LQCEHAEDWFGVVRAEDNVCRDEFAHEFKMSAADWQRHLRAIGPFVNSLARGINPDIPEAIAGDDAIERPGINRKQRFPAPFGIGGIAYGNRYLSDPHGSLANDTGSSVII
jgi:hypothetical protein